MNDSPVRAAATPADDAIVNVVAVASGKGGVGKTWLSISLAQALTKLGERVLLFDGDLGLANIDVQLGIQPGMDLGTALERHLPLSRAVISYPNGGFDLIAGRSGSGTLASMPINRLQGLSSGLRALSGSYGRVVVDLGAGIERPVRYLAGRAGYCLVVTTDEPTALTDAYALIKMLTLDAGEQSKELPIGVVVNMAASREIGQRTYETLSKACDRFLKRRPPLLGVIRRDPKVRDAISTQTPLLTRYPNSPAAQDIETLAKKVLEATAGATPGAAAGAARQAKRSP
ncbi:MAG TPA: MinD/ParA family protein [Candidatus Binatia bacterium]|nr:MinD/ParA family protein [Candidatus Binatia bacterium]